MSPRKPGPLLERVIARIDATGPCWIWTAGINAHGYGRARFLEVQTVAHRLVWTLLVGPVPNGLELDHLCRNRRCVNPDHLEPVTHAENTRRGAAGTVNRVRQLGRDRCARGHEYTPENTKQMPRQRKCRTCIREDSARARSRIQGAAA